MAKVNSDGSATEQMRQHTLLRGGATKPSQEPVDLAVCSSVIDYNESTVLNANAFYATLREILEPNPDNKCLISDVDEQVLLNINFADLVSVTHIGIRADTPIMITHGDSDIQPSGPQNIHLFRNNPTLDFSEATATDADQIVILTDDKQLDGSKVALRGSKFQRCKSIQIFVEENQKKTEWTFLNRVIVWGFVSPAYRFY